MSFTVPEELAVPGVNVTSTPVISFGSRDTDDGETLTHVSLPSTKQDSV